MEGDSVPCGYRRSICHHSTLETKAVDYESEANLSYTSEILYQQQPNKQLHVSILIDVGSFYYIDALKLRVVLMLNTDIYTVIISANFIFTNMMVL